MKKKLVIQSIEGETKIDTSSRYLFKKVFWHGEVVLIDEQNNDNVHETMILRPKAKLLLEEMMEVLQQSIEEQMYDEQRSLGYRLYHLK